MRLRDAMVPVLAAAAMRVGSAFAAETGYYSQPALHGETLIFVSEGDLWRASFPAVDEDILAYRLTSGDGTESHPVISPDGQWLAFSAEYDGNTDVYLMPVDGGAPKRLTFHPLPDIALGWTPDSRSVLFRSSRQHPHGRDELWRVGTYGGMPMRFEFGQCTQVAFSATGSRFAFTPYSNESWTWKRYRGGTAPDIWVGDTADDSFRRLTDDPANDMFPMWLRGRVYFLSDRSGAPNIHSMSSNGGDLRQHTTFAPNPNLPAAVEGYDVRWPGADSSRGGQRIAFCQGGALAVLDVGNDRVTRLKVTLASDRIARRQRFADAKDTATEYTLSPDGKHVILGARGELLAIAVEDGVTVQLTRKSGAREWGAGFFGDDQVIFITDEGGEQQIAVMPIDGSDGPSLVTADREAWLFPPVASPDRDWIAFADKTMRLHVIDMKTLTPRLVAESEAGEITDYRFSPDSRWLAYTKPEPNGYTTVHIHALRTQRSFQISTGFTMDREPRWDPAGKYLYFLSDREMNARLGRFDFEHVYLNTTRIVAVPLTEDTPPPVPTLARAAGFDLEAWAKPAEPEEPEEAPVDVDPELPPEQEIPEEEMPAGIRLDTVELPRRQFVLPIEPGNYQGLEAVHGGLLYLAAPVEGLRDEVWPRTGLGDGKAKLIHHDLVKEEPKELLDGIGGYRLNAGGDAFAAYKGGAIHVHTLAGGGAEPETVALDGVRVRVDIPAEWKQILDEAWRLQRDFYWAPNYGGVDWPSMREKYAVLVDRVGTRDELSDVLGEMFGELRTSHTYNWGGEPHDEAASVAVGMLGADVVFDGRGFIIERILPSEPWDGGIESPLAAPHVGISEGNAIFAVNGVSLNAGSNLHDLLQDQAGKIVRLTVADDWNGINRRTAAVKTIDAGAERSLRYTAWVERNREYVEQQSDGRVGYVHIPDMGGGGLAAFSRLFYPQVNKRALVIDVRDNGGGFVSEMIIERLSRRLLGFSSPRHGMQWRYPYRAPYAHMATLIDQHAGSDGDIFPAMFRKAGLGPLIGVRTWGGVVGIRADKPHVDFGISTQPEFAWWEPESGWSIENYGVDPDIEVPLTPGDRLAGRDPQLDKALEVLHGELAADPKDPPQPPAFPRR